MAGPGPRDRTAARVVSVKALDPGEVARYLADPRYSIPGSRFPKDRVEAARAGLYVWWVDDEGRTTLEGALGASLPSLIYAGQAGAASSRAGKESTATLLSRIGANHLRGTAHGSTFRKSMSALLLKPLELVVERPDRLTRADNERVTLWMRNHLSVTIGPYDDRLRLGGLEAEVLHRLDPPLNLQGMPRTPVRRRLTALRSAISRPDLASPGYPAK